MCMFIIIPIESKTGIVGWRVIVDGAPIVLSVLDLPVPSMPTDHQILHVARTLLAPPCPPKPLRRARRVEKQKWSVAHDRCQDAAIRHDVDIDLVVSLLPDALESLTAEWEQTEPSKRAAHALTGLKVSDVERIDNAHLDYTSCANFDTAARTLAYEFPELNWNVDDDNSQNLWNLLHAPLTRRPARFSADTIDRACQFAGDRQRGEIVFAEWSDDSTLADDPAFVPF